MGSVSSARSPRSGSRLWDIGIKVAHLGCLYPTSRHPIYDLTISQHIVP